MKIKVYEKCHLCGNVPCAYREGGVCFYKGRDHAVLVARLKRCPGDKKEI